MMLVSLIMAVGRIMDRLVIEDTSPAIYSFAIYLYMSIYLGILVLLMKNGNSVITLLKERPKPIILGGAANAYSYVLLLFLILVIPLSVAEPLSMLSVIVSIILSLNFFHEGIRDRLVGAIIMFTGALLLVVELILA